MNIKERAKQLTREIPVILLAMRRKETPLLAKLLAALAVAYALSPIDLIPDFIPVIGLLDDVILVPALIALAVKMIPAEVIEECRREAAIMWDCGKPRKWYYALPVIAVWLLIVAIIAKVILRMTASAAR